MNNNLQDTLYGLSQSGTLSNPAYNMLLHDYTKYHAVLFIEGGIFTFLLVLLNVYFWQRFGQIQKSKSHTWTFEKKAYFCFGLVNTVVSLFMLLIVTANLSNILNPQVGFAKSIPDLGTPQAGTQKAKLYQAVNIWLQGGSASIPTLLQNRVQDRLSWQRTKAIVCSILLAVFSIFTMRIWQKLLRNSQTGEPNWSIKEKILLITGVIAVPVTLLLMIMALANTQASFAPITLTLLFG